MNANDSHQENDSAGYDTGDYSNGSTVVEKSCKHCIAKAEYEASLLLNKDDTKERKFSQGLDIGSLSELLCKSADLQVEKCLIAAKNLAKLEVQAELLEKEKKQLEEQFKAVTLTPEDIDQLQLYKKHYLDWKSGRSSLTSVNELTPDTTKEMVSLLSKSNIIKSEENTDLEEAVDCAKVEVTQLKEQQEMLMNKLQTMHKNQTACANVRESSKCLNMSPQLKREIDAKLAPAGFGSVLKMFSLTCRLMGTIMCRIRMEGVMFKLQDAFESVLTMASESSSFAGSSFSKNKSGFSDLEHFLEEEESKFHFFSSFLPDESPALGMLMYARDLFQAELKTQAIELMTSKITNTLASSYRMSSQVLLDIPDLRAYLYEMFSGCWEENLACDWSKSFHMAQMQALAMDYYMYGTSLPGSADGSTLLGPTEGATLGMPQAFPSRTRQSTRAPAVPTSAMHSGEPLTLPSGFPSELASASRSQVCSVSSTAASNVTTLSETKDITNLGASAKVNHSKTLEEDTSCLPSFAASSSVKPNTVTDSGRPFAAEGSLQAEDQSLVSLLAQLQAASGSSL